MTEFRTRVRIAPDHSISGMAPEVVPAGDHEVVITLQHTAQPKVFRVEHLPTRDLPWDDRVSLRREDMYGDDGR